MKILKIMKDFEKILLRSTKKTTYLTILWFNLTKIEPLLEAFWVLPSLTHKTQLNPV